MENNEPENLKQSEANQDLSSQVFVPAHTLAEDIMRSAQEGKPGTIKEIIDAEEEKQMAKSNISPKSMVNQIYVALSILLIVVGGGVIYYFTAKIMNKEISFFGSSRQVDILHSDQNIDVDISDLYKNDASRLIYENTRRVSSDKGKFANLHLKQKGTPITFSKFLKVLDANFSLNDKSGLSENFILGVIANENKDPFLLLQITNFNNAFPVIQSWEKKMFLDMYAMFGITINEENRYLLTKNFEDTVVENKNTRVLTDDLGNPVFMYTFVSENIVVFSNSKAPVQEVVDRVRSFDLQK